MSKNYTLQDVETLRGKAGVSYEEAVSLLDKYDGDIARALIELEKRGQLGADAQSPRFSPEDAAAWCKTMWSKGLNTRVVVERKGDVLVNLPVLFLLLMLIMGPYAMIAALIIMLICGCSVSIRTEGNKDQTILKGEDTAEQSAETPIEPSLKNDAPKKDDDDFPSITIS